MRRTILPGIAAWLSLATALQTNAQQQVSDALILVQPMGAQTMLAITFPSVRPHESVRARLETLSKRTGWSVSGLQIRDDEVNVGGAGAAGRSLGKQTSATAVLVGAPQTSRGGFLLQPYVEAFHDLARFEIIYFIAADPGFQGLRDFRSPVVDIHLVKAGGPYRYLVETHDRAAAVPLIPVTQPSGLTRQGAPVPAAASRRPRVETGAIAAVVGIAAGAALAALVAMLVYARMRGARPSRSATTQRMPRS